MTKLTRKLTIATALAVASTNTAQAASVLVTPPSSNNGSVYCTAVNTASRTQEVYVEGVGASGFLVNSHTYSLEPGQGIAFAVPQAYYCRFSPGAGRKSVRAAAVYVDNGIYTHILPAR